SDGEYVDEKDVLKRESEKQALIQLKKAQVRESPDPCHNLAPIDRAELMPRLFVQSKPVAFAIRTNVSYDASIEDNCPVSGYGISFGVKEYLHIKEVTAS